MIAAIFWLLSMCTKLRKRAAGDIVSSLTRLEEHRSELKLFVLIFQALDQINISNRGKWQPSKIARFFLTYISHTMKFHVHKYGTIKPPIIIIKNHRRRNRWNSISFWRLIGKITLPYFHASFTKHLPKKVYIWNFASEITVT